MYSQVDIGETDLRVRCHKTNFRRLTFAFGQVEASSLIYHPLLNNCGMPRPVRWGRVYGHPLSPPSWLESRGGWETTAVTEMPTLGQGHHFFSPLSRPLFSFYFSKCISKGKLRVTTRNGKPVSLAINRRKLKNEEMRAKLRHSLLGDTPGRFQTPNVPVSKK